MSKKCPICGRGIGVYQDYVGGTSFFRCDICGHTGCDFEDMTLFDRITQSPETLAEKFIFKEWHPIERHNVWYSLLLNSEDRFNCDPPFDTKEEAFAATVAKLKEVGE